MQAALRDMGQRGWVMKCSVSLLCIYSVFTPCLLCIYPNLYVLLQTMSALVLVLASLAATAAADKGPSQEGYDRSGSGQQFYTPQVKYAGPIVYSGEKPPIIHFPPPPEVHIHCPYLVSSLLCPCLPWKSSFLF